MAKNKTNWLLLVVLAIIIGKPLIGMLKANPKFTSMLGHYTMPTLLDKIKEFLSGDPPKEEQKNE